MKRLEATQILYEIALSVGQTLELNRMLRHSLGTMMRLCNFNLAVVIQTADGAGASAPTQKIVEAIPRSVIQRPYFNAFLERMDIPQAPADFEPWLSRLPLHYEEEEGQHWYAFALSGFGVLVVRKHTSPIHEDLFNSLPKLMEKLAQAIRACIYEQELKQQMEAAQSAERTKSLFMANISHEIRTPMNGILGLLDVVLDHPLPEEAREQLKLARLSAEHLLGIINAVLDLSRIDAGKMTLEAKDHDLPELLIQIVRSQTPTAHCKRLQLKHQLDPNLPRYVQVDATRLRQIIINLMGNAIKFTEKGEITLKATLVSQHDQGADILLSVEDTGIGIPTHAIERIFETFEQGDNTYSRMYEGTGLGLAITRKLITLMGGEISVTSEVGKGSKFTIQLTLPHGNPPPDVSDIDIQHAQVTEQLSRMKLRILVAEDNLINQMVIKKMLDRIDAVYTVAENGLETVEMAARRGFDLIFMDMMMPLMDGLEATCHIRQQEKENHWPNCPIIAITANAMAGDRERYLANNIQGYVAKPIQYPVLIQEIDRVLTQYPPSLPMDTPDTDIDDIHIENEPAWFIEEHSTQWRETLAQSTQALPFDWNKALRQIGDDESLLIQVLAVFLEGIDDQLQQMQAHLAEGKMHELGIHAHTLKGQCGTFCASAAKDAAQHLETLCRNQGNTDAIRLALDDLMAQMATLLPPLREQWAKSPPLDQLD
ncbi:Signal transduction histidine kinase [Ectothiorhodospira magna]|uniref:histidine kinase n=1 Tax=Ectothiorhodospira magna TaxID=867345 RepID=A0A1H9A5K6_9GAMM|nr:ATP-binding protein [Ectothiorhodospira magna]SEP71895.1 Signal transduction histidine kinase [Ectothiorhodospira magna]